MSDTDTEGEVRETAVFVGLDVEWEKDPKRRFRNIVLAYGLSVLVGDAPPVNITVEPGGPEFRHRLSLGTLLGRAFDEAQSRGVLKRRPTRVTVVTHYGRGDLAACRDFPQLRPRLQAVHGTLATASRPAWVDLGLENKSGLPDDRLPRVPRSSRLNTADRSGNEHYVAVRFVDTYCLAPEGASLEALGELLGRPKLALPPGQSPAEMGRFKQENPEQFFLYLRRDAEIVARYAQRFDRFCRNSLGLRGMPSTLGGAAVAVLQRGLKEAGLDRREVFGLRKIRRPGYSAATGHRMTVTSEVLTFAAKLVDGVAADAYSGGRTETFMTGPIAGPLHDVDERSAYPTAMASCGLLDYSATRLVGPEALAEFTADRFGVAEIEFETPARLPFPVFAVKTERGLLFVRRGITTTTAPEIAAALYLGVSVRLIRGVLIPWDDRVRIYERFVVHLSRLRESLKVGGQDTLESKCVKTIMNALYGKTAQAVVQRSQYDAAAGSSKALSRSSVTSPAYAAYTTGLVRAMIAEQINSIPRTELVVSVSTDGYFTSAGVGSIGLDGPATRVALAARRRIVAASGAVYRGDHAELLEVKKQAEEVVAFRNRGIATTDAADGSAPVLAKNGIKVPKGEDANRFVLEKYLGRNFDTRIARSELIPLREQLEKNADLVAILRAPRVNFEPDMKRRLVGAHVAEIRRGEFAGVQHLATTSEPYGTVEEALLTRSVFEAWRHVHKGVLKTKEDWDSWQDYFASTMTRRASGGSHRVTRGGSEDVLKRMFLRALVRGQWGLALGGRSHKDVARWLTERGHPTTLEVVKNATRPTSVLTERSVAFTPEAVALLRVLLAEFPGLEVARVFAADDLDAVQAAMNTEEPCGPS